MEWRIGFALGIADGWAVGVLTTSIGWLPSRLALRMVFKVGVSVGDAVRLAVDDAVRFFRMVWRLASPFVVAVGSALVVAHRFCWMGVAVGVAVSWALGVAYRSVGFICGWRRDRCRGGIGLGVADRFFRWRRAGRGNWVWGWRCGLRYALIKRLTSLLFSVVGGCFDADAEVSEALGIAGGV